MLGESQVATAPDIQAAWTRCVQALGLPGLVLLSQSSEDSARRTYKALGVVYKITLVQHTSDAERRAQRLAGEFELLKACQQCSTVPRVLAYWATDDYECLSMAECPGHHIRIGKHPKGLSFGQHLQLLKTIGCLAACGISHNDIKHENILVHRDGSIYLIDFDQARFTSPVKAFAAGLFGITLAENPRVHGSYMSLLKEELRKRLPPRLIRGLKRLLRKTSTNEALPLVAHDNEPAKLLRQAWNLAQLSNANAPGGLIAYYAMQFDRYYFPGERPWEARWDYLRRLEDFRGKRVLELGCNMGLLSCHLLQQSGASAAFAVDADRTIIRAAALVAKAFGVQPQFAQVDFDSDVDWEHRLADFRPDIVFALNVLNWLEDKERFLRFLGRFRTVVLEGHDDSAVEEARLATQGFTHTKVVTLSERGRPVIVAKK